MDITLCQNCQQKKGRRRRNCQTHSMTLRGFGGVSTKIKQKSAICLCPVFNKSTSAYENVIPRFMNDGKSHLPAFVLPTDWSHYEKYEQKYLKDHIRKVKEHVMDKTQMWEPKPNGKNKYCSVCKSEYEEYLDHIRTEKHHTAVRLNRFDGYINQIAKQLQKQHEKKLQREFSAKCGSIELEMTASTDQSKLTI